METIAETTQLQTVSAEKFEKEIEIEISYLTYMNRLKPETAYKAAKENVSKRFVIG